MPNALPIATSESMPGTLPKDPPARLLRRITHVTETPLGGVVTYLDELVGGQLRSLPEVQIDIITPEINREALAGLSDPRFNLIAFRHRRGSPSALLSMALRTLRHVRRTRPDILHLHSSFAGAAIRPFAPLFPKETQIVYCPHGWAFSRESLRWSQRVTATVERWLAPVSDSIVCISEDERRQAEAFGIPAGLLVVIENGISPRPITRAEVKTGTGEPGGPLLPRPLSSPLDPPPPPAQNLVPGTVQDVKPGTTLDPAPARLPNQLKSPPCGRRLIAFVGRFEPQKGFEIFLEVMRRLEGEADGIAIGSAVTSTNALPECPANVRILGWKSRDAVFDLYRHADLLLVPSRWEGFGLVAAEAMQAGLAVFASRVGGLQDIVVDGETGRLLQPGDVDGIVALIRATSDADLQRFGENGRHRYLARYTAEHMTNRVIQLYDTLLNESVGR